MSDLDVQLAPRHEPTPAERAAAIDLEHSLDDRFPQINGAGILLSSATNLTPAVSRAEDMVAATLSF